MKIPTKNPIPFPAPPKPKAPPAPPKPENVVDVGRLQTSLVVAQFTIRWLTEMLDRYRKALPEAYETGGRAFDRNDTWDENGDAARSRDRWVEKKIKEIENL